MKKYIFAILILVCLGLLVGCNAGDKIDYSQYSFTDISWTRDAEHDEETIRFNSDGSFSYYCGCGNPVNDSDLCERYTYDDETKIITFDYFELTEETIGSIKIVKCDEKELHLDFDGETRVFIK